MISVMMNWFYFVQQSPQLLVLSLMVHTAYFPETWAKCIEVFDVCTGSLRVLKSGTFSEVWCSDNHHLCVQIDRISCKWVCTLRWVHWCIFYCTWFGTASFWLSRRLLCWQVCTFLRGCFHSVPPFCILPQACNHSALGCSHNEAVDRNLKNLDMLPE